MNDESHFSVSLVQLIFQPFENGSCLKKLYLKKKEKRSEVQSYVFLLDCVCYTIDPMVSQCGIPVVCVSALLHKSFLFAEKLFLSFRCTSHKSFFFPGVCETLKFIAHPMV